MEKCDYLTIRHSIHIFAIAFLFLKGFSTMHIKIHNLSEGLHEFTFHEPVETAELAEPFYGKFRAKFDLQKAHNQIILDADLSLDVTFECDRCATDYKSTLKTDYRIVYLFGYSEDADQDDNVEYLAPEADKIELASDLRDFALLAVPMKKLCKEDCKGLCYKCGKDLNLGNCNCSENEVDPRWEPLKKLNNKLNTN